MNRFTVIVNESEEWDFNYLFFAKLCIRVGKIMDWWYNTNFEYRIKYNGQMS